MALILEHTHTYHSTALVNWMLNHIIPANHPSFAKTYVVHNNQLASIWLYLGVIEWWTPSSFAKKQFRCSKHLRCIFVDREFKKHGEVKVIRPSLEILYLSPQGRNNEEGAEDRSFMFCESLKECRRAGYRFALVGSLWFLLEIFTYHGLMHFCTFTF